MSRDARLHKAWSECIVKNFNQFVKLGYFEDVSGQSKFIFQIMEFLNDKMLKFSVHKL